MRITTTKKFDKQFKKQTPKTRDQFTKRIGLFLLDINHPALKTHKLSGKMKNQWSFNVSGDTRVVFEKIHENIVILVVIGSHSELYS